MPPCIRSSPRTPDAAHRHEGRPAPHPGHQRRVRAVDREARRARRSSTSGTATRSAWRRSWPAISASRSASRAARTFLGALQIAHEQGADACVATIFCDDNKKYLSTDLCSDEECKPHYMMHRPESLESHGIGFIRAMPGGLFGHTALAACDEDVRRAGDARKYVVTANGALAGHTVHAPVSEDGCERASTVAGSRIPSMGSKANAFSPCPRHAMHCSSPRIATKRRARISCAASRPTSRAASCRACTPPITARSSPRSRARGPRAEGSARDPPTDGGASRCSAPTPRCSASARNCSGTWCSTRSSASCRRWSRRPQTRHAAAAPLGSLTLDPALPLPKYVTGVDIHCMPGGYAASAGPTTSPSARCTTAASTSTRSA
jgi:hypothetical protein